MSTLPPRLIAARGARHAEELVVATVLETVAARGGVRDGAVVPPAAPLHVVVPSQTLRLHVMQRLVATAGASLLGVHCHTHYGLALRILDALGETPPRGLDLFPILARRFARREDHLVAALDHLREGYDGILGAVRDLLDAGFQPAHLEAIEEALSDDHELPASDEEIGRAQALARVTARTLLAFDELGVGRISTLLAAATEGVKSRPERALASSGILLHGFADATGVTTDFLTAVLETYGGAVVLDRPPDPVRPDQPDPSADFTRRLEERFSAFTEPSEPSSEIPPSAIELFRALGEEAEVREVAQRCLDLVEGGTAPESIAVVMREPRPYRSLVRRLFGELALPYSAPGLDAPVGPVGRRIRAWIEIIGQGSRCHVERWLDAMPERIEGVPLFDLRVALAALGISRLEQLAELELDDILRGDAYPLPVRQGFFEAEEDGDGSSVVRSLRRRVPRAALESLLDAGRRLSRRLDDWATTTAPLDRHLGQLEGVMRELGWGPESPEAARLAELLDELRAAPPITIDRQELVLTVRRLAADLDRQPLGGRGGGVQVMGVVEARGTTFEHLFLLGMNRGVFPRTVREDPVLSDALRKRLARAGHGLLPDLPIKRRGYQEERYLFADLLSAAPRVTLSWLELDDDDRPMTPSPLIERLRWSRAPDAERWRDPPVAGREAILDRRDGADERSRRLVRLPPRELLVLAALEERRERLPRLWRSLLSHDAERGERPREVDWAAVARARRAVVDELDPPTPEAARNCLSPYLGFIGPPASASDPRVNRDLYVTTVERMAACPWQTFLERLLRVEAVPDPLEALPQIDALMIGIVVHRVLEAIVTDSLGRPAETPERDLAELLGESPVAVSWPPAERLEELLSREAEAAVRSAGVALAGFARALAAVARPYLDVARRVEWGEGTVGTLGAEIHGSLPVSPPSGDVRRISFRADRLDRDDQGDGEAVVLVDYKTGSSPFTQQTPSSRHQRYLRELARGSRLQPALYAAALGDREGSGRFGYLRPDADLSAAARRVGVDSDDREARRLLDGVLRTVLGAWEHGLFFPRLELPQGVGKAPPACQWCRVAEACLRQDSGTRRRLRLGMERLRAASGGLEPATRTALLEQWWLATPEHRPERLQTDVESAEEA